jgi:hypothetical protein
VNALSWAVGAPDSSQDVRCCALLGLAKRAKQQASADFAAGFASRDWAVKSYALMALAAYGDDRAWDEVMGYLGRRLAKRNPSDDAAYMAAIQRTSTCWATGYLARHLQAPADAGRSIKLVELLRRRRDALTDEWPDAPRWFAHFWPGALDADVPPGDVLPPNLGDLERWIRSDALFAPADAWREPWPRRLEDGASSERRDEQ